MALSGCGNVGAAIARTIPDEYRWIGFVIAAMTLAVWNYSEWRENRRLQLSHLFLTPMFGLAMFFVSSEIWW